MRTLSGGRNSISSGAITRSCSSRRRSAKRGARGRGSPSLLLSAATCSAIDAYAATSSAARPSGFNPHVRDQLAMAYGSV